MLEEEQRAVVDAWQAGAETAVVAERFGLLLDVAALLLPLHAEGGIGEHVVEGPPSAPVVVLEGVPREGVPEADVVVVLALDEHVGLADRPRLVVPVLPEEVEVRFRVEGVDVLLGHREHSAGAAGRS